MLTSLSLKQPFTSIFWLIKMDAWLRNALLILLGSAMLTLASKITIPLHPIPVTLQTLAVLFIGMTYGWRLGAATILAYIGEALIGIPVLAGPIIGLPILLDPSSGYLLGFIPAVIVSGYLAEHGFGRNPLRVALAAILGNVPLYLLGLIVLSVFVGIQTAINVGLKPFLLGDALKIVFLACVVPAFWKRA